MTTPATHVAGARTPANVALVAVEKHLSSRLRRASKQNQFWLRERDQLIREAHAAGASLREIAALVDLSHVGVKKIIERTDFEPNPTIDDVIAERIREAKSAPRREAEARRREETDD